LLVADAGATLAWEEPVTHVFTLGRQAALGGELRALRAEPPTRMERSALGALRGSRERVAFLARSLDRSAASGSAIGEIRLPRIDERLVLVKGSSPSALRTGPGTYDGIGLPGVPGTAAIAGHRTTYGAPFRRIDELRPGDPVVVVMPYATFTYRVERTRIVRPTDLSVLARRRYDRLVLSACHPRYSAEQRIVVLARLERTVPAGTLAG
jgi:sortase A